MPLPAVSKSSDEEKEMFLARVEWLPVTSRSHVTDVMDKCNISTMILPFAMIIGKTHPWHHMHVYMQAIVYTIVYIRYMQCQVNSIAACILRFTSEP